MSAPPATRGLIALSDLYRRVLAAFLGVIAPAAAYALLATLARTLYRLFDPLRQRSEAQCRAALGDRYGADEVSRIARQAFVHRAWNLVDLMLALRLIRRSTFDRRGGRIPEPYLSLLRDAQRRRQPVILLTAYYGPYDLLPLFLGFNGIRAGAIYRPHRNLAFDAERQAVRGGSGCVLIPDHEAVARLPRLLEEGDTVAILADHHAARHGVPATFLGLPTAASRAVGILAERYAATVAVAGVRRRGPLRFEVVVTDFFGPSAWREADDAVVYITQRYLAGLERMILADPTQYLWAHARWNDA